MRESHGVLKVEPGLGVVDEASVIGLLVAAVDGHHDGAVACDAGIEAGEEEVQVVRQPCHPGELEDAQRVVGVRRNLV